MEKKQSTRPAVATMMYRLNVEPKVIDHLARIAARTGEPKTRLARRLFTDAVLGTKVPNGRATAKPS